MGGTQVLSPDSRAAESHRGRLGETGPGSESPHTGRCPQSQPGAAKGLGQLCLLPEPGTGSAAVCMCLCVCVWSKVVASNSHCQADQKSQSPPPPALSESLHRFGFPLVQLTPPGRNRKHVWPAPDRPPHPKPPPNIGFRFIKTQAPLVSCPSPHTLTGQDRSSHSLFSSKCSEWMCVLRTSSVFLHGLRCQPQLAVSRKAVQVPEPLTEPAAQGCRL